MTRSVSTVRVAGLALIASLALVVAAGCGRREPTPAERALFDFTLKDSNGQELQMATLRGKALVVNFWATWCGPCKIETPMLEALSKKYRHQGLTILGIETDAQAAEVQKFADAYKVTYPLIVGVDRSDVHVAFDWTGVLPTSVFIRADGTVARRIIGLQTEEYWEQLIQSLF